MGPKFVPPLWAPFSYVLNTAPPPFFVTCNDLLSALGGGDPSQHFHWSHLKKCLTGRLLSFSKYAHFPVHIIHLVCYTMGTKWAIGAQPSVSGLHSITKDGVVCPTSTQSINATTSDQLRTIAKSPSPLQVNSQRSSQSNKKTPLFL